MAVTDKVTKKITTFAFMVISLSTPNWGNHYELIDSGNGAKLERFGQFVLSRPEPQALWSPSLDQNEWERLADATFVKAKNSDEKGEWIIKPKTKQQWWMEYKPLELKFRLGLTAFKHVGIFPEQAANWDFIAQKCTSMNSPKVLNLFAYTGGATLAAARAGANVTHVDSVKQTVSWSRENLEESKLDNVRWVVEDALKFVKREVRRGSKYNGIILDPPSYGRGADGEKWVLTENIFEMLTACAQLLEKDGFLVLNLYSMGLSGLLADTLVRSIFPQYPKTGAEIGELYVNDKFDKKLPLGVFLRF